MCYYSAGPPIMSVLRGFIKNGHTYEQIRHPILKERESIGRGIYVHVASPQTATPLNYKASGLFLQQCTYLSLLV